MANHRVPPDRELVEEETEIRVVPGAPPGPPPDPVVEPVPPDAVVDEETEVRTVAAATPGPPPAPDGVPEVVTPGYVHEEERLVEEPDGSVRRVVDRVEEPPRRRRAPNLAPALLVLLALVLGGLAAVWYFTREETKPVPSVTGMRLDEAVERLESEGFDTDIEERADQAEEGTVFAQDPRAGTEADEGASVRITVSTGPETKAVPNAVGLEQTEARDRLAEAGFEVNAVEVFSDKPEGAVIAQNPPAGRQVAPGETVRINISKGTGLVDVPSLVGRSVDSAEAELQQLGLRANVVEVPSPEPAGTVVAQNPTTGQIREGSAVRLNVSSG